MFEPLYSVKDGGPFGFRCKVAVAGQPCNKVLRTYRGAIMHCNKKHGLKLQMEMFNEKKDLVSEEHVRAGGGDTNGSTSSG